MKVHLLLSLFVLLIKNVDFVVTASVAPPLVPGYLPPTVLTSRDSLVSIAWLDFSDSLDVYPTILFLSSLLSRKVYNFNLLILIALSIG